MHSLATWCSMLARPAGEVSMILHVLKTLSHRCDLESPRPNTGIYSLRIQNDRKPFPRGRMDGMGVVQMQVALIVRVDGQSGITEDGLRACRANHDFGVFCNGQAC